MVQKNDKLKVLFITHNTKRAGAPLVLYWFLEWLKQRKSHIVIHVLDLAPGSLQNRFKDVSDEYISLPKRKKDELLSKVKSKLKYKKFYKKIQTNNYDIVYANTVQSVNIACEIKSRIKQSKIIAHVHELNTVIQLLNPKFQDRVALIDRFIAVSQIVKSELNEYFKAPIEKINLVREFSQIKEMEENNKKKDLFIVGASGTVDWRKGYDVFIQVALWLKTHHPEDNIEFFWVGKVSRELRLIISADLKKLGLENIVTFYGEHTKPYDLYSQFDVFVLPSREDPFPLVCIEMGQLGKPIICFDKGVGTAEVIKNKGGKIVNYLSIGEMGKAIIEYKHNNLLYKSDSEHAKAIFSEFTIENQAPKLFEIIESI